MDKCRKSLLSFEVGQVVELKSFIEGYRGAWFKCKIKEIRRRNRQLYYALEYVDFPDEKIKWTKVYQLPRTLEKSKEVKKELMVRPSYPPMHHENEAPKTISEVVVIFNSLWKVGDMIDCYWSANVTKILDGNKAKIELMPIPLGEGLSYEVCLKDVRPSLDWSPQHGWTLPVSQDGESNQCCALLIYPADEVAGALTVPKNDGDHTNGKTMDDSAKLDFNVKDISIVKEVVRSRQTKIHPVEDNKYTSEINRSYSNTCDVIKDVSDEKEFAPERGRVVPALSIIPENIGLTKGIRFSPKLPPREESSLAMDPEGAVLHLEELLSKVKWLKGLLKSESSFSTANAVKPNWKILPDRPAPSLKR